MGFEIYCFEVKNGLSPKRDIDMKNIIPKNDNISEILAVFVALRVMIGIWHLFLFL
jgi:hypothetical protein